MTPKIKPENNQWNVVSVDFNKRVSCPFSNRQSKVSQQLVSTFAWAVQQVCSNEHVAPYIHSPSFDMPVASNVRNIDFRNRVEVDAVFDTVSKTKSIVTNRLYRYGQEIGLFIHQINEAFAWNENVFTEKRYRKYLWDILSWNRSLLSDEAYVSWIRQVWKNYWFTKNEISLYTRIRQIEAEYSKRIPHLIELLETIKRWYEVLRVDHPVKAESYSYFQKKLPEVFSESCLKLGTLQLNAVSEMIKSI